ncbi:MAG: hypothetical protein RL701_2696 [Pseudomonadota bacterium]
MDERAQRDRAHLNEAARAHADLRLDESQSPSVRELALLREGLSQREALLTEAERVVQLGSWAWDLKTNDIAWSDGFCRILGVDARVVQPSSATFFAAIHPEDRARVQEGTQSALARGSVVPIEYRIVRPSGEQREVRMDGALLRDSNGGQTHVVGTVLDVTEQRRSAHLLARTLADLNEAQRIAGLASWRWTFETHELHWSVGMFRLLDIADTVAPSEDLYYQQVHHDDYARVRGLRDQIFAGAAVPPCEYRVVRASGEVRFVVQHMVTKWDEAGTLMGISGVVQDITERKTLEEQLLHSQKMEAVGTLAGGVAHDFNNYLMVIAGYTELLCEQVPLEHPARESVQAIGEAYQRCAHLTQQLLTLSRKRQAEPVSVELSGLVTQLAPLIRSVLGELVQLDLALDGDGMWILADPLQVEQALMNLVVNARDAMPNGGELVVRVEPRDPHDGGSSKRVCLTVEDVGCGIPLDLHLRIFEPFFTTKQVGQGTGLGLSTVYAIVRDSGAQITFESEPGRGTAFHIDWPRFEAPVSFGRKTLPPLPSEPLRQRTILLVEDVARVRELLARQLTRAGYRVHTAPHGVAALEHLAKNPVDLVLSDMIMPLLGGVELVQEIQQRHPEVQCLLMTGYSPEATQDSRLEIKVSVLRKPFSNAELLRVVQQTLMLRRQTLKTSA